MPFADLDGHGVHRAAWPRSRFCLVTDGAGGVALDLTARLPAIEGDDGDGSLGGGDGAIGTAPAVPSSGARRGELAVLVNGAEVARFEVGPRWTRRRLEVGRDALRRGLNRIELAWPPLPPAGDAALAAARRRLETGLEASLHPVFGEVASLRATAAAR
jgi:hypothetical protein